MNPPAATPAHVFWLFGLSGAGKSTLAAALTADLRAQGRPVLALDGDRLRAGLCAGLGFTDEGRQENLRRAAEVARLAVESGIDVVAAFITPRETQRELVRRTLGPSPASFIFVTAPLELCVQRDVKGLYAAAAAGRVARMTGVADAFDAPHAADLVIDTTHDPAATSAARIRAFAASRLAR